MNGAIHDVKAKGTHFHTHIVTDQITTDRHKQTSNILTIQTLVMGEVNAVSIVQLSQNFSIEASLL